MTEIDQKALEAAKAAPFRKYTIGETISDDAVEIIITAYLAATTSNAAETAEPAGDDELADLVRWVELWNRVCATAWGDDDKLPPPWSEVAAKELPNWNLRGIRDAEGWGGYMRQRLILFVDAYLYKIGRHPRNNPAPHHG